MSQLTHLDETGAARMVDVGAKAITERSASARASVYMRPETLALIASGGHTKGDVLAMARVAGIQAAKKCPELIPLCHPLMLNAVDVAFELDPAENAVHVTATCRVSGRTGVEMEALTAASIAALTLYDMCKSVDRGMSVRHLALWHKSGGKSGEWRREASDS